jgi:hypothetical protein
MPGSADSKRPNMRPSPASALALETWASVSRLRETGAAAATACNSQPMRGGLGVIPPAFPHSLGLRAAQRASNAQQ